MKKVLGLITLTLFAFVHCYDFLGHIGTTLDK